MKNRLAIIFFSIGALSAIFLTSGYRAELYRSFYDWMGNVDREYYEKMKSIKVGMMKDEVISILGKPDLISNKPDISETHGRFGSGKDYGIKITNRNVCLIYHHGNDIIGHFFIDEKEKVYFVNVGGT